MTATTAHTTTAVDGRISAPQVSKAVGRHTATNVDGQVSKVLGGHTATNVDGQVSKVVGGHGGGAAPALPPIF